jgi:protein-S-isoprenylcysteine O-methyltransferase Ste14
MEKTKAIIASYVGVLLYAGLVFLGAWKTDYWQGFLYLALALAGVTLSHVLVPAGIGAILLVVRTVLEDRFLVQALPGYADYTNRTPRKLLPGLF